MDKYINLVAVLVAALALWVSYLSWRASILGVRASTFDRRYEIYTDAESFLAAWMRHGRPDLGMLPILAGAWSRSHFLCGDDVTKYLRKLWLDAIRADQLAKVISGEYPGDHGKAVEEEYALLNKYTDFDTLRVTFMSDLKVQPESIVGAIARVVPWRK